MCRLSILGLLAVGCAGLSVAVAAPLGFTVNNLASDVPGLAAFTDPDLRNAWGIASGPTSPFWLGANGSGEALIYNGAGVKQGLVVSIPGDGSVTGVAFGNISGSFNNDIFLFDSEDGTVSGWRPALGTAAETLAVADPGNVYKGVAIGTISGNSYAYLANFRTGSIDVLKGNALAPDLSGKFTDPNLPAGYAPFDVQNLNGILYVTYAEQDAAKHDDAAGAGHGFVDAFNLDGTLIARLVSRGDLNSPWGLALAPAGFGGVGGALLVGNFGDGRINAYDPSSGAPLGPLQDAKGNPLFIEGLWGLHFGNGGSGGNKDTLYFTAGPSDEKHGVFGDLIATPEPGTWLLGGIGLLALGLRRRQN